MLLWACFCAMPIFSLAQGNPGADFYLDKILKKLRVQGGVKALSATVVIDGKIVAYNATGIRKKGNAALVTKNDLFAIGSITKTITGFLAARMIQQSAGNLSWNSSISDFYPNLASIDAQGFNSTIGELMRFRAPIGLSGLTHASCDLNNFADSPPISCQAGLQGVVGSCDKTNLSNYQMCGRDEFVNRMLRLPVAPYVLDGYNNNTPVVVSALLQKSTNRTFENLLREELFLPLGMLGAKLSSQVTDLEANQVQLPFGHDSDRLIDAYKSDWNRFHVGHASGGVMMTPKEMGQYLVELMPGSSERRKILTDESLTTYFSGDMGMGKKANGGWFKETITRKIFTCNWLTSDTGYWHNGWHMGFRSVAFVLPEKKFGYFCLATDTNRVVGTLEAHLVNMWYQQDFLPYMPKSMNGTISGFSNLANLLDNDFLTTWTSGITNDVIACKPKGEGLLGIVPYKAILIAYPRNIHNIDKIQVWVRDQANKDTLLTEQTPGMDNTLFVFRNKVFTKELRIQFLNKNNKKTTLSEIKLLGQSNDPRITEPIEVIRDPVRLKVDPVIYVDVPVKLQKPMLRR